MTPPIPPAWQPILGPETEKPYYRELQGFLREERAHHTIYPPEPEVFTALELTPFDQVKVFLLGQDPYPGPGQAHGLAFSVRPEVPIPPSLLNIFKELRDDLGCFIPNNGYLVPWAEQGVLLLNAVLTVRAGQPNSHQGKGWEKFTDAAIRAIGAREKPCVFLLWGNYARKKVGLVDVKRHVVIESPHPSPLSARRGFFGSRPFSQANAALRSFHQGEIDWQIPNL